MNEVKLSDIQALLDSRFSDLQIYMGGQLATLMTRVTNIEVAHTEHLENRVRLMELDGRIKALENKSQAHDLKLEATAKSILVTDLIKWVGGIAVVAVVTALARGWFG